MSFDERVTGIVLSAVPQGEYDKRITLLTRQRGKITAFARGVRRPGNSLMAACSPFAFGDFYVYRGKTSYSLNKAEISNYFRDMASDYDKAMYGFYFLEVCDYFGLEGQDESNLIKLVYAALKALEKGLIDIRLIKSIFDLKMLYLNGTYPDVFKCDKCGSKKDLSLISVKDSVVYCSECARDETVLGSVINPAALYAMQYVITASVEKLFSFTLADGIAGQFERMTKNFFSKYINHSFKSGQMLI